MMQSMVGASRFILLAIAISVPVLASAQDADPGARLERIAALTSLNTIDQKPWHLKLDVTVFDNEGKNPKEGTIEVWRSGEDSREVEIFGESTETRLKRGGDVYWSSVGPAISYRVSEILEQILHPGPTDDDISSSTPILRKVKFGKVPLDCIMLSQVIKGKDIDKLPLGLYPTYCLEPAGNQILMSYNFGSRTVSIKAFGTFLDHVVPTQMEILEQTALVARAKINALGTYKPQPDDFVPLPEMKHAAGDVASISGDLIAGSIISKVQPVYPASARANHVGGTVRLHVIIGRDGHVYAVRPLSSPDPDLTIAAIAAVRQWTYKPYLLNGVVTKVDTTIVVNFNLNRF